MRFCIETIWPPWAPHWVRCGSAMRNGRCAQYGHNTQGCEPPQIEKMIDDYKRGGAMVKNLMIPCPACGGTGAEKVYEKGKLKWVKDCSFCYGSGRVNSKRP